MSIILLDSNHELSRILLSQCSDAVQTRTTLTWRLETMKLKTTNEYQLVLEHSLYELTPKAVFAAIAVSMASCGGDQLDESQDRIIREWWTLHDNGIVPQKPPFKRPQDE